MQKLGLGLKHTGKAVKGKFLSAVRWSMYSSEEVWDHDDLQNTKQNILFPRRVQSRIFRERYKNKLNCWETDLLRYVFRRGIVGKKWVLRRSQIVTQDLCCGMPHGSNVGNGRRRPPVRPISYFILGWVKTDVWISAAIQGMKGSPSPLIFALNHNLMFPRQRSKKKFSCRCLYYRGRESKSILWLRKTLAIAWQGAAKQKDIQMQKLNAYHSSRFRAAEMERTRSSSAFVLSQHLGVMRHAYFAFEGNDLQTVVAIKWSALKILYM